MVENGSYYVGQKILGKGTIIAIDGPSGSGKSTVARLVAAELYLNYLDTGAMYRALTLYLLWHHVDLKDEEAVNRLAGCLPLTMIPVAHCPQALLDGKDVMSELHSQKINESVSLVAAYPRVRQILIDMQRHIVHQCVETERGIVIEGRDTTTVVSPEAQVRVLLTASEEVRRQRRLCQAGASEDNISVRDSADSCVNNFIQPAPGVSLIDTTSMTKKEVVNAIVTMTENAMA